MEEADIPAVGQLYEGLSLEDRYRRFFSAFGGRGFAPTWFAHTRDNGFAVVAVVGDGTPEARLVAEAGYVMLANGDAEFGLTVAHDWRGWLGPYLLDVLVEVAASRGIPNLEADILAENRPMRSVVAHRGVVSMDDGADFSVVRVAIAAASEGRPSWPETFGRPRVIVETSGGRWAHTVTATRAGFEVLTCGGPEARCPALQGHACPLATGADVIVMARPPSDPHARDLLGAHARVHEGVPVVVGQAWRGEPGAEVCSIQAGSTGAEVVAALKQAIQSRGEDADPG